MDDFAGDVDDFRDALLQLDVSGFSRTFLEFIYFGLFRELNHLA